MDMCCKAGLNFDGYLAGDVGQTGLDKPFMVIQHDMGSCSDSACRSFQHDIQAILRTVPRGASYHISIKDTEHFNFTDYAVHFSPLLHVLGLLGSIDGQRGLQITRDRKSTRLNSSHTVISYAVFCLEKNSTRISSTHTVISYAVF